MPKLKQIIEQIDTPLGVISVPAGLVASALTRARQMEDDAQQELSAIQEGESLCENGSSPTPTGFDNARDEQV